MNKRLFHSLLTLLLLLSVSFESQANALIDSLQLQLLEASMDDDLVDLYTSIGTAFYSINQDSVAKYYDLALQCAKKTPTYEDDIYAFTNKAVYYTGYKIDYPKAILCCDKALKLAKENNNHEKIVKLLNNLGVIYWKKGDYKNEVKYKIEAHYLAKEINDTSLQIATLTNLGLLHEESLAHHEAIKYFEEALVLTKGIKVETVGIILNNIGLVHLNTKNVSEALEYFEKSLTVFEELKLDYWKSLIYNNIAYCYSLQGQYKKAFDTYDKALVSNQMFDNKERQVLIFVSLAQTLEASNQYIKAINKALKTLSLQENIGIKTYSKDLYLILGRCYELIGDFKNASFYFKESVTSEEAKLNEDKKQELSKMKAIYSSNQKNEKISFLAIQNKETLIKNQRTTYVFRFSVVLFLFILAILGLLFYRMKLKQLKKYDSLRSRLTNDLHDNVGSSLNQIKMLANKLNNRELNVENKATKIARIKVISDDLISNMYDLIWTIDKDKEKIEDLINHMRDHASNVFTSLDLPFRMKIKNENPNKIIDPAIKNNIYSVYKEAINNIVKHSRPELVYIYIDVIDNLLVFKIENDSTLILENQVLSKKGLSIMTERAKILKGKLNIKEEANKFVVNFQVNI